MVKNDRTFLWICGASASGKRTLLNRINEEKEISIGKFHINGSCSIIDLSLNHGKADILITDGHFVVIKAQMKARHLIEEIKQERPQNRHCAIFLRPPLEKHQGFFYSKFADSRWLKNSLGIERALTRKESNRECVRDRKFSLKWMHKKCPVEFEIVDPLTFGD